MKKAAIVLVVVLGLFVAVDFGSAAVAEYQVSKQMRQQLNLAEDPAVRINGFPFLWQAAVGDYRNVELEAKAVKVGALNEVGIGANLRHARIATSEVVAGTAEKIKVDEVDGRVELKASDVGRFLGITDLRIAPAPKNALQDDEPGGDDASGQPEDPSGADPTQGSSEEGSTDRTKATVQLDGSVDIGGTNVKVQVMAVMSLLNGKLEIDPRKLDINTSEFGNIPLPPIFERSVLHQFSTTLDPGELPFRVTPTAVDVEHGALIVEGTARDVTIDAGGVSTP